LPSYCGRIEGLHQAQPGVILLVLHTFLGSPLA
jgi:hypothetical protein